MKYNRINNITKILILFLLLLVSCNSEFWSTESDGVGAVVLTFDDKYIDEWYTADSIFSFYDWKATFCVTAYGKLTEKEKLKVLLLQNHGHEIASHGTNHINASDYLLNNSIDDYLNIEIFPSLNQMKNDGLDITSFVYPGGVRSVELDLVLFDYFTVLRGTTYDKLSAKSKSHFLIRGDKELLVCGLGIDNHYAHFDIDYIKSLIDYAHNEKIALILYGHKIADNDKSEYITSYDTITDICKYVQQKEMEFLTLKELENFNLK